MDMKLVGLFFLSALLFLGSCGTDDQKGEINTDLVNNPISADGSADTSLLPKFKWKEQVHDFGIIVQGEKVSYTYTFTNVGKSSLVISSVHASCGCTVPKYDTEPILPGKNGKIEVVFDSSGRTGVQSKTLTVLANTQPNSIELHFTAEVLVPENK